MGGKGSTRWGRYRKKVTVEDCRALDLARLADADPFRPRRSGTLRWQALLGSESAAYAVVAGPSGGLLLVLTYRHGWTAKEVRQAIPLESTPNGSRLRWWGRCPLPGCGRRLVRLYRPRAAELFGCRECHRLTYASRQRHDKGRDRQRREGEDRFAGAFPLPSAKSIVARFRRDRAMPLVEPAPG